MASLLETDSLTKRFGAFVANDAVSLTVRPGDRLAVLGENGAGKSTMMRMLAGELQPDGGRILWHDEAVRWRSARDAQSRGIGMVHQHFLLVGPLSAAENVGLGYEPRNGILLNRKLLCERVRELGEKSGLVVDPNVAVEKMTVAAQQKVEILKALYRNVELLILDEPTASLAPQESADLIANLRRLSEDGLTLLFVSHKLPEVMELCNRIAVLRAGKLVATLETKDTSIDELASLLVGGSGAALTVDKAALGLAERKQAAAARLDAAPVLRVSGLRMSGAEHETGLEDISFDVRPGEILAIAGVDGNGQAPLADALIGLRDVDGGSISLDDHDITHSPTYQRYEAGIGYLPEDRQRQGMILDFSLAENLALGRHDRPPYARGPALAAAALQADADAIVEEFSVRTPRIGMAHPSLSTARSLSGGNQQKFLFGREVGRDPHLLIAYQPTRGLDIGATQMLHDRLRAEAARGRAVLLISLDLDEVLSLADRIAVLYHGRIAATVPGPSATREGLGRLMIGGGAEA
ncbi:MAG TPA: ABC transporter ATP-binding protein [Armatimonadota bacterium]|jgi:simple sugar transport system ATP-binding protein